LRNTVLPDLEVIFCKAVDEVMVLVEDGHIQDNLVYGSQERVSAACSTFKGNSTRRRTGMGGADRLIVLCVGRDHRIPVNVQRGLLFRYRLNLARRGVARILRANWQ
jgi:hypothetical protein